MSIASAVAISSCTQTQSGISGFHADFGQTGDLPIATSDVKVVCARVEGESKGLNLLGFIPLQSVSETAAIKNMYDNARARGAKVEGESRHFVNKGIERVNKNFIIFSIPTVIASGDLVQYMTNRPVEHAAKSSSKDTSSSKDKGILSYLPL